MSNDLDLIYERMGQFAKRVFPDATAKDHLKKLEHESKEAQENPSDLSEYADCLLCLFGAATKQRFTFNELVEAARNKLFIVENREWKKQPDGTYQHIEQKEKLPIGIAILKTKSVYKDNGEDF